MRRLCLLFFVLAAGCARPQPRPSERTPIVIAHRGASGARPEHTLAAYRLAIRQGADFVEPDLVCTKDGVLICRHENELGGTTDVAGRTEFADRKTTKTVDGIAVTGWFSEDFTLAEIKTLRARERIPDVRPANAAYDGRFAVPTLREVIALVRRADRPVGIYPETKHPTYFAREGRRLDGTRIGVSLGGRLVETLVEEGFTDPERVFIQSFEFANLIELKRTIFPRHGVDFPLVQLYGDVTDSFVPPRSGFSRPYDMTYHASRGDDLRAIYGGLAGLVGGGINPTTGYGDLTGARVLRWIARRYAAGVGPWAASLLLRRRLDPPVDGIRTQLTGEVAPFLHDAKRAGLLVHPYTLRAEQPFRTLDAAGARQSMADEMRRLLELGADGFFTDHPARAVAIRDGFVRGG